MYFVSGLQLNLQAIINGKLRKILQNLRDVPHIAVSFSVILKDMHI